MLRWLSEAIHSILPSLKMDRSSVDLSRRVARRSWPLLFFSGSTGLQSHGNQQLRDGACNNSTEYSSDQASCSMKSDSFMSWALSLILSWTTFTSYTGRPSWCIARWPGIWWQILSSRGEGQTWSCVSGEHNNLAAEMRLIILVVNTAYAIFPLVSMSCRL